MSKTIMKMSASRALFLAVMVGLSGCANIPQKSVKVDDGAQGQELVEVVESVTPLIESDLPNVELDASTLELLLTRYFANYSGDLKLASSSALKAAQATQDYRLARDAAILGLQNNARRKSRFRS